MSCLLIFSRLRAAASDTLESDASVQCALGRSSCCIGLWLCRTDGCRSAASRLASDGALAHREGDSLRPFFEVGRATLSSFFGATSLGGCASLCCSGGAVGRGAGGGACGSGAGDFGYVPESDAITTENGPSGC
eukprot:886029-Prymnesium_polylepis.1